MADIAQATQRDLSGIQAVLREHRADPSIRGRSRHHVSRHLGEFVIARGEHDNVVGCAALEPTWRVAELSSVAVAVSHQGQGIGVALVEESLSVARAVGLESVWLATTKPVFFRRTGFEVVPYRSAPLGLHFKKLLLAIRRPHGNWKSGVTGEMVLMKFALVEPAA